MLTQWNKLVFKKITEGYTQFQVSVYLKKKGVEPNNRIWIERRIDRLHVHFGTLKMPALIYKMVNEGYLLEGKRLKKIHDVGKVHRLSDTSKLHTEWELTVLKKIAQGLNYKEVSAYLKLSDIMPNSLSMI